MKNKFFLFTGIILALLVIFNIVLYGAKGIDLLFFLGAIGAILLLFYPKYERTLSIAMMKLLDLIFIIGSVLVYLTFILVIMVTVANLPKQGDYPGYVEPPAVEPVEEENYRNLVGLTNQIVDRIGGDIQTLSDAYFIQQFDEQAVEKAISEVDTTHDMLLSFLAQNVASMPKYSWDADLPHYPFLQNSMNAELFLIKKYIREEKYGIATERYYRLWEVVNTQLSSNISLIGYMNTLVWVGQATDFYFENHKFLKFEEEARFLELTQEVLNKIDTGLESGIRAEALTFKNGVLLFKTDIPVSEIVDPEDVGGFWILALLGKERMFSWPLLDYFKTFQRADNIFSTIIDLSKQPLFKVETKLEKYDAIFTETQTSFLVNPTGSALINLAIPKLSNLVYRKETQKSRLEIMRYLVENMDKREWNLPPVDNLTGKEYKVDVTEETIQITSGKDGKINYKILIKRD